MKISEVKPRYRKASVPTRVTVRLRPELAAQLDAIRRSRKLSVTALIEQALTEHLGKLEGQPKLTLLDAFRKHGVLGAVDLGPDASRNYKELVAHSVAGKYGYR